MEASDQQPKFWSNAQTYSMAGICLVLGVVVGYLVHSPEQAKPSPPAAATQPQATGNVGGGMPSAEDMKRMAEKQVAPMLAELQRNPKNAELLEKIGHSYLAAQQYGSAQQYLEQSVALKATPESLNELAFVQYSLGDVDKAIAALERAHKLDPKNPQVLFNLGMFEWHGKSDPKAAIAAWENLLKVDPKNPKRAQVEKMIAQAKHHLNIAPGTRTDKPAS